MTNNPNADRIKLARQQLNKLETMSRNLTHMGLAWEDLDGGMVADLDALNDKVEDQIKTHRAMINAWRQ